MALVTQKDGSVSSRFTINTDGGIGTIEVAGDDVRISAGKVLTLKKNYVSSIEKKASQALNKAAVELCYFDLFGNKETRSFLIAENDFRALKKALGK